ncbi:UDP-N-acetylmuramoyl-L-alanyl-D-glutamate--2,6-diaminopimelate ligase [Robiginitomaculum antarcticum]|uniref:UDP-N-acetylmuramoyl-L-alanyl-D-glutamate--2, 6-diaminopimelate ligase n=1 Tax=Robiginitomaculum antarcticum TaxID=437507 RepID=UPI00037B9BD4|nr:UDP-N-acetylmuramoyl-L-alanyl-D-glutamate--2,6-diaminopimelate ligase [Robiginitomaculum antarcticum]
MKLSMLIATLPLPDGAKDVEITSLTADSRAVKPGALFAALKGVSADGWDYVGQAIENGAVAILSRPGLTETRVPVIETENARETYAYLAARLYAGQPETLVAVTGTNGKSSTVEFLRQIWSEAGLNAACFGTLGIATQKGVTPLSHTTPDAAALQMTLRDLKDSGVTYAAMEASSHGLKQYRLDGARLSAVAFTNLTQDHFDYHPNVEDYFMSKARLFKSLAPQGIPAIINVDSEYGQRMAKLAGEAGLKVITTGWNGDDLRIAEVTPRSASQSLLLIHKGVRHTIELPLAGEFQVLNAVSAAGLAMATGVNSDAVFSALSHLKGVNGRMDRAGVTKTGAPVFVDFAHTPDGLEKLLRGVRPHTQGRIVVVFGCGGDRDPGKRPKMGAIAHHYSDIQIVTDDNPRTEDAAKIRKAVMSGCPNAIETGDREAAILAGLDMVQAGDCLVIAGKGHESGQIVGTHIIPFKDADVVRRLLKAQS